MSDLIDISLYESIAERWHSVGWEHLTDAEREVGCVYRLHWHLLHGGLSAVLGNLDRPQLTAAIAGLARISAPQAASLVSRALAGEAGAAMEQVELDLAKSEIAAVRLELPERYATEHPDEFPGPRSLVGIWESMRSRGVLEKPQRLVEFEELAGSDARFTDRRCATCGQPVPTYRSSCRRCGRLWTQSPGGRPNDV